MVVILNRIISIVFVLIISLNASDSNSEQLLNIFKKDYLEKLKLSEENADFCKKKSDKNLVHKSMFKNIEAKGKKLNLALLYININNDKICENKTLENLLIATSNYLYALERYDEKNIDLYDKIEIELKGYQQLIYIGKQSMYNVKHDYDRLSNSDKKKLEEIKELKKVFNFDSMM
ncbi:MAG: hypothetical protein GY932_11235 [Arcobacter sp.]|nr:hypothetical protein [Arcobacter sp.]